MVVIVMELQLLMNVVVHVVVLNVLQLIVVVLQIGPVIVLELYQLLGVGVIAHQIYPIVIVMEISMEVLLVVVLIAFLYLWVTLEELRDLMNVHFTDPRWVVL
jgi:hypothetical protein